MTVAVLDICSAVETTMPSLLSMRPIISMAHMNHLGSQGPFGHPVCDVQMLEAVAMLFFIHDCKGRCTLPLATVLMSTERLETIE